jgi:hypothetical protein
MACERSSSVHPGRDSSGVRRLAEGPVRSHGTFEDHARLCPGRGDDFRIGALFCRTLMEKIVVGAPRLQRGFHEGAAIACSKKPRDVW